MIGAKIKAAREAKRFSQDYMAAKLQISQASYSRLESDITKTDLNKLQVISDLLELNPYNLFDEVFSSQEKIR